MHNVALRVTKNTLAQMATYGAMAASKFLIVIFIARLSGAEDVGDFSFVITFTWAFNFLTDLGMGRLLVREVAKRRDEVERYVNNSLTICLFLGVISVLVITGSIRLLGDPQRIVYAVCLAGVALVMETIGNLFRAAFRAFEKFELETITMVVQETIFLITGPAILYLRLPFLWLFVAYTFSRLAGTLSAWVIYLKQVGDISLQPDYPFWRQLLRKAFPFTVDTLLSTVYVRIDVLMLSFFHGNFAVGYYEAATNIFYRFNVMAWMVNQSLLPLMSREYAANGTRVEKYVKAAVKYQLMLGMPLTVGALLLSDKIILFLYGKEFQISIQLFQLLASITVLRLVSNTLATTLTAVDLQGRRATAIAMRAAFNVLLNLFMIPRYSFLGASISTVATEIFFFLVLYTFLTGRIPRITALEAMTQPALSSGVMAVPLLLLPGSSLLLLIPLGATVYVLSLFLFGTFSDSERRVLLNMVQVGRRKIKSMAANPRTKGEQS